ncbi:monocarboxylate transporter 12-like isoform X3 [Ostrea edulis]|uniref:monocarboxylate transporter 12-like isoform X3 n=1 Tax=Ostrea edulis TaxID=37623 RepID=UPI0024AF9D0E|nr:monocarboxylate transporter 12-like isoform X3 [Ostrea edulis]
MHRLCCIKFASREGSSENTTYRTPYCTGRETRSEWCGFDEKTMKRENAVPIDRGWAWMILLANFLVVFLVIGFMSSFGIFFAEFMSEFNAPASSITIALSLQTVVFSLSSLLVLNIGSRVASIRTYIIVSGFFACSAYLISAVITDVSYLVLSHGLIFGIAYGFSYGPALVILGRYFDKKRGIASSLGNTGVSFGSLVFPPIIRALLNHYGLRGTLVVVGGIHLHLCVAGALMRPIEFYEVRQRNSEGHSIEMTSIGFWSTTQDTESSRKNSLTSKINTCSMKENCTETEQTDVTGDNKSDVSKSKESFHCTGNERVGRNLCNKLIDFKILRNPLFRMWIPVCFLAIIGCVQIVIFIPPHAKDLHISDNNITLLVMIVGASNLISKILSAFLIYCNVMPKHQLIAVSLIITGVSSMFISFYTDFLTLSILSVIFGVFGSVYFGLFPAVLVDFVGLEHISGAMAINMLMQGLGLSISNPILGFLRDTTGTFHASFYLMGTTLIGSGSILFLEPLFRKKESLSIGTETLT